MSRRTKQNARVRAFFSNPKTLRGGDILVSDGSATPVTFTVPSSGIISLPEGLKFKGVFSEVGRNGFLLHDAEKDALYIVGATNLKLGRSYHGDNAPAIPYNPIPYSSPIVFSQANAPVPPPSLPPITSFSKLSPTVKLALMKLIKALADETQETIPSLM